MPKVYRARREQKTTARRFASAGDAARELHVHCSDWSVGLGKYGLQIAFALMAANWALYGSQKGILSNPLAKASMAVGFVYLALFLMLAASMFIQLRLRHRYADADKARWTQEFEAAAGKESPWPYTQAVELTGNSMHVLHFVGPLIMGYLLLLSTLLAPNQVADSDPSTVIAAQPLCCSQLASDVGAIRDLLKANRDPVAAFKWPKQYKKTAITEFAHHIDRDDSLDATKNPG